MMEIAGLPYHFHGKGSNQTPRRSQPMDSMGLNGCNKPNGPSGPNGLDGPHGPNAPNEPDGSNGPNGPNAWPSLSLDLSLVFPSTYIYICIYMRG